MEMSIAFDSHKCYTLALVEDEEGRIIDESRIEHERGAIREYLESFPDGTPVAVETIGTWYWIVDEIEAARKVPRLVHARKAKLMSGEINKTDKLDVRGLSRLQRVGTLPTVWIPPGEIRDKRDVARTRMVFARHRTRLKNRIHATLAKYALHHFEGVSDIFGKKGRERLEGRLHKLPEHTQHTTRSSLGHLDETEKRIAALEARMEEFFEPTPEVTLLMTLPGVGPVLSVVIAWEVGDVSRFHRPQSLASYAGTTPRIHASGGKVRYGRLRPDVNRYLKGAFSEAANSICVNRKRRPERHVSRLYIRMRQRKGHAVAIGAVARTLAESTYWVLTKREAYREAQNEQARSRKA
ncbi:MAG: IS110 family transposase [Planctomycetes bacterium]|nr:IS110 family transposase [Planctomycetota bacterium]